MLQVILVGIGAGVAAALLFIAPLGGTAFAFPLFLLTGLPISIAGLGWGLTGGALAALAAAALLGGMLSVPGAIIFLGLFGGPALWLARQAGLSRATVVDDTASPREWYPLGRLLLHAALAVAIGLSVAGYVAGYDADALAKTATDALIALLAEMQVAEPPPPAEIELSMRAYAGVLPFVSGVLMTIVTVFSLWVASRIVRASGRLVRPAVPLWTTPLAREILIGFAAATVLILLLPEIPGFFAQTFAGAFSGAMALVGLAVLHALTLGIGGRTGLLAATYVLTLLSGLPLVLFTFVGAADAFVNFRARRKGGASPSQ